MPIRVGQMCFDPHSMMILAKIGFGAAASLYFDSPIVGTWWSALVCLAVVWSTYMESKVLILLISAVGVLACAAAVWLDLQLSTYFNETIRSCADWQSHPCYCAETQDEYLELTRFTGDLECNNPFTRNPSYLTGNTFLTALTAFITLVVFLSTVGNALREHVFLPLPAPPRGARDPGGANSYTEPAAANGERRTANPIRHSACDGRGVAVECVCFV
ncbi:hypothetical protein B484DRAFT_445730 [Ochromonadaceae sp. CCMP2298]|nr:hypothetical protein B484DRAFT_445730 [Ochromonadaceae sp. CCMP2298]